MSSSSFMNLDSLDNSILPRTKVPARENQPASVPSAGPPPTCPPKPRAPSSPSSISPPPSVPRTLHFARGSNTQPSDGALRLATELVRQRDIGHYGLTAASVVRHQSSAGALSSPPAHNNTPAPPEARVPAAAAPATSRPAHAWKPPETTGGAAGGGCLLLTRPTSPPPPPGPPYPQRRKRSVGTSYVDHHHHHSLRVPASKRPRRPPPGWIDLGHIVPPPQTLAQALAPLANGVSPLFFSRSSTTHTMPKRAPSFQGAEHAGPLLSRLRDDQQGAVRTVKLPKGPAASSASPARAYSINTPGSVGSDSMSSRSSEGRFLPSELRDLQGLSVIDLLEADDRPTFIIDLVKPANFGPGPLQILFVNTALRASQGTHELISQNTEDDHDFARFKAWAVSLVKNQRPVEACLPSISYGGIVWTCTTLANRFRFVSGSATAVAFTPTPPAPQAPRVSPVLEQRRSGPSTPSLDHHPTPGRERALSDLDYFGDAQADPALRPGRIRRAQSEPRDLDDLRPETPIVDASDLHLEQFDTEIIQSYDWTRISDISGKCPLAVPLSLLRKSIWTRKLLFTMLSKYAELLSTLS